MRKLFNNNQIVYNAIFVFISTLNFFSPKYCIQILFPLAYFYLIVRVNMCKSEIVLRECVSFFVEK